MAFDFPNAMFILGENKIGYIQKLNATLLLWIEQKHWKICFCDIFRHFHNPDAELETSKKT